MVIDRQSIRELQTRGIEAETVGLQRMANGAALVTLETTQAVKARILEQIQENDDPEASAALANAMANIIKAEAALIKALGGVTATGEKPQRNRKSFAAVAPGGPIEVQSA